MAALGKTRFASTSARAMNDHRGAAAQWVRRATALHDEVSPGLRGSGWGRRASKRSHRGNRRRREAAVNSDSTSTVFQPRSSKYAKPFTGANLNGALSIMPPAFLFILFLS